MNSSSHLDPRDLVARAVGVVGLAGVGLIHLLDIQSKFSETPYMAWMYLALIIGTIVVAADMIFTGSKRAWFGAIAIAGGALVGFTLTRTTGLPQAHGDIGNWMEPLGLASLWVEGCLVALSAAVLALPRRAVALVVPQSAPRRDALRAA